MADRVVLDHVALTPEGPTLALRLVSGQSLAVVGRAGAGKSRFLSVVSREFQPARGKVHVTGSVFAADGDEIGRRTKLQALAASEAPNANERAAEALSAAGLWNARKSVISELTDGQRAAASLVPALVSTAEVIVIDGHLDELDPWTLRDVTDLLTKRMRDGQSVCLSTNQPTIAARTDALVVLKDLQIRFAGSPSELVRAATVSRVEVHSDSHPAVRALVRPFEVTITETDGALRLEAAEGQQLAAKLLLEGYGDVKFVLLSQASVESALLALL